jgi:Ca2+-binding EF-hand superfamily protein
MATDLHLQKLANRFHHLDADGDGYIEHTDYEIAADRVRDRLGHDPGHEASKAYHDAFMELWHGLLRVMDADGDGRISRDEFVAATSRGIVDRPGGFEKVLGRVRDAFLEMGDRDGDGRLTAEEFGHLFQALGVSPEHTAVAFKALDADGDGHVTREELARALEEFYMSSDADAPGSLLFGPLNGARRAS